MEEQVYSQTQPQVQVNTPAEAPQPPVKRRFPVKLFAIAGAIVLLAVASFALFKTFSKKTMSPAEITWWGLWEDDSVVSSLISEYEKANPKIKIKYVNQSKQDYRERLTNAIAKGTAPDIFRFHNTWVPMFKSELDFVPSSVMNASDFFKDYYPVASSDLSSGSGFVGIPLEYDALTLYINEDIFALAAKEPPTTWDELRQLAIELTKKDEQGRIVQSGVALGRTENVDHWQEILGLMMLQNGVNMTRPSGKLAEDSLTFYTIFSSVDGVWDSTLPSSTAAFAGGKLAMYFGPSWRAFNILEQNPSLKFKTVPLPQLPKVGATASDVAYATYWVEGVWAKSKNKTAAWDFLKFISTKESLTKMYTNSSRQRLFGEPYPRVDMANLLTEHAVLNSIIKGAPYAQSWYLASRTFDGPTGINSLMGRYFEDAVNAVNSGTSAEKALEPVQLGVLQVLSQYGLIVN
ncbi:MAG: extracellular solute-binding protein [bacterium]|nr:extracellular solute-binding protein [bacterium]